MNRRGFIRTALCGAGATVGAMLAGKVGAKEPTPGITPEDHTFAIPQRITGSSAMQSAIGPDPSAYVHLGWRDDSPEAVVLSAELFFGCDQYLAIPHAQFPEYSEKDGIPGVLLTGEFVPISSDDDVFISAIRSAYVTAIARSRHTSLMHDTLSQSAP